MKRSTKKTTKHTAPPPASAATKVDDARDDDDDDPPPADDGATPAPWDNHWPLDGQLAEVTHEAIRAWCRITGQKAARPWRRLSATERAEQVESLAAACALTTPGDRPWSSKVAQYHLGWMGRMLRDGWRYGPRRNTRTKSHPLMLPYSELPAAEKFKVQVIVALADIASINALGA